MDYKKKLLIAAVILVAAIGVTGYYLYASLSYKPQWYSRKEAAPALPVDTEKPEVQAEILHIEQQLQAEGRAEVSDKKLTHAVVYQVKKRINIDAGKMVKAAKWHPQDSTVEMEMVVDLTKIPREKLSPRAARAFDRVIKLTRGNILDNVYVKAELPLQKPGRPVNIDAKSKVHIGRLEFTVEKLEKRTGINARKVLEKLGWMNILQTDSGFVMVR